jgi:hypothetical protein
MRKHLVTALVLIIATAGIAACGGDDDDQSAGSPSTDKSEVGTGDTTEADASTTQDFSDLLKRQDDAVIKITYKRGNDEFTIAQDHEKRSVTDGKTKVIVTDDGTINCDNLDTTPTCLDVSEGVDSLVNVGLSFYNVIARGLADASEKLPGLKTTQDEIAGREATCAEADSNAFLQGLADSLQGLELPSMNARVCIDNETGYLLEFSTDQDATDDLVAIEVTEPSASDFKAPVPLSEPPDTGELPGDAPAPS